MQDGIIKIRRIQRVMEDGDTEQAYSSETLEVERGFHDDPEAIDLERSISRWDRFGKWCLYLLIALVPIFFLPYTIAPVETTKILVVGLLTILATISFLVSMIERRTITYPRSSLSLAVLGLVAAYGIATLTSSVKEISLYGNLANTSSFLVVALGGMLFFLTAHFFDREDIPAIGKILGTSIAVSTLLALLQAFGISLLPWSFAQQTGFTTFGSLFGWGTVMAMALAATTVLPFENFSRGRKITIGLFDLLLLAGLLLINHSLIWVSLAFLMVMISAARFVARESLGLPIVVGILAVFLALISQRIPVMVQLPLEVRPNFTTSFNITKETLWGARALNGSGPATFGYEYTLHRPVSMNQTPFWNFRFPQAYNYILTAFGETGVFGLFAIAFLLLAFLRIMIPATQYPNGFPVVAGVLFLLISWFFYPASLVSFILLFIGLGTMMPITDRMRSASLENLEPTKSFLGFMAAILLIATSLASFYVLGQRYYAAVQYGNAVQAYGAGDLPTALARASSAIQWDGGSDQYFRAISQMFLVRANQLAQTGGSVSDIQVMIANAVQAARRATELNPRDAQNWSNAGNIYENLIPTIAGTDVFAVENYQQAMKVAPTDPQEPVNAARSLVASGRQTGNRDAERKKLDEAQRFLDQALVLKPDYAPARYLLAQIFLREGNVAAAVARTEEIKAANPLDAGVAFQLGLLYYDSEQLSQAQAELERAVALNAEYANARYFLGLTYDRRGMRSEALEQFRRIAEGNPDNQEVRTIINNLEAGRGALSGIVPPAAPPEDRVTVPVPDQQKKTE